MKLPAGTYYIGDPCYMFPHDDQGIDGVSWDRVCDIFPFGNSFEGELVPGYGDCFVHSTAYGDGVYPVFLNMRRIGSVGVDAGLIGIFPEALVNRSMEVYGEGDCVSSYVRVTFDEEFAAECTVGNFEFWNDVTGVDVITNVHDLSQTDFAKTTIFTPSVTP